MNWHACTLHGLLGSSRDRRRRYLAPHLSHMIRANVGYARRIDSLPRYISAERITRRLPHLTRRDFQTLFFSQQSQLHFYTSINAQIVFRDGILQA